MDRSTDPTSPAGLRAFAAAAGGFAFASGALSILGWALDVPALASWGCSPIAMQPNTSVAAAATGAGLLLGAFAVRRAAVALGGLAAAIGAATVVEHLTGADLGIDRLLLFDRAWGTSATVAPGRMGPPAATCFTMLGAGLCMAGGTARGTNRARDKRHAGGRWGSMAAAIGVATMLVTLFSLIGYALGAGRLYANPWISAIAFSTAVTLFIAGAGLTASVPGAEPMRTLLDPGGGGVLARRTLPCILLLPPLLAWLATRGEGARLFGPQTGRALLVVALTALLLAILWSAAAEVSRRDANRRAAEARLARRSAQFATLLEAAPIGVVLVDDALRVLEMNPAARADIGDELVAGRPIEDVLRERLSPEEASQVVARFRGTLDTGEPFSAAEFGARRTDRGETRIYDWRIVRIPLPDGRQGVVCYFRDITDAVAARESIRRSERGLLDADRKKDEFLATLAHELRNPLAPLMNSLELMRLAQDDPRAVEAARATMHRQMTQMVRLVDDLLDVGRITRDRLELRKETIRLDEAIGHAVEAASPSAASGGQHLAVRLPAEPLHVHADPTRITQVLGNLLHNACKFTPRGGSVVVEARREAQDAVVTVRDDGIGIPPDQIGAVFDMFTQLDPGAERSRSGLGIGLTLVKRLVEMHGGSVTAQSEGQGRGSAFTVRLPLAPPPADGSAGRAAPERAPGAGAPARPRRILVVDDNRDSATTMAAMLRKSGDETIVAHDGPDAVRLAASAAPDVVLLDIGLPGMDGYDVCRAIRAAPGGQRPVIVAVTGWGQDQDRERSRAAGFDAHVVKPVDRKALLELIARPRGAPGAA